MQEPRTSSLGTWEPGAGGIREHCCPPPAPGLGDSLLLLPAPALKWVLGSLPAGQGRGETLETRETHVWQGKRQMQPERWLR